MGFVHISYHPPKTSVSHSVQGVKWRDVIGWSLTEEERRWKEWPSHHLEKPYQVIWHVFQTEIIENRSFRWRNIWNAIKRRKKNLKSWISIKISCKMSIQKSILLAFTFPASKFWSWHPFLDAIASLAMSQDCLSLSQSAIH